MESPFLSPIVVKSRRQTMSDAKGVIDAYQVVVVFVCPSLVAEKIIGAEGIRRGNVGQGIELQHRFGDRANPVLRDDISRKGAARNQRSSLNAGRKNGIAGAARLSCPRVINDVIGIGR